MASNPEPRTPNPGARIPDPGSRVLSILTPAFNEAANLPALYARLVETMGVVGGDWEWIVVDDHSGDETFAVGSGSSRFEAVLS